MSLTVVSQKVLIARAIAQEPKILLLDEPINHLDIYNQIEVMKTIESIVKQLGIIAIVVMHDLNIALRFFDKFILLKDKKIFSYGNLDSITSDCLKQVYNIDVTIRKIDGIKLIVYKF
jgi:iron complex transport system ATP-binding protein